MWKQTQLSGEYVVRLDGKITLPLVGEIAAGGLTPDGVAAQITRRLDGLVLNPKVSVAVNETTEARISVLGEVRTPGRFAITDKDGVLTALSLAGGLTEFARTDGIYVLRQDYDGKRVRIRFDFRKLAGGQGRGADFLLRNGDIVVIE